MAEKSGFKPFQFDKIKNDKESGNEEKSFITGNRSGDGFGIDGWRKYNRSYGRE